MTVKLHLIHAYYIRHTFIQVHISFVGRVQIDNHVHWNSTYCQSYTYSSSVLRTNCKCLQRRVQIAITKNGTYLSQGRVQCGSLSLIEEHIEKHLRYTRTQIQVYKKVQIDIQIQYLFIGESKYKFNIYQISIFRMLQ